MVGVRDLSIYLFIYLLIRRHYLTYLPYLTYLEYKSQTRPFLSFFLSLFLEGIGVDGWMGWLLSWLDLALCMYGDEVGEVSIWWMTRQSY